MVIDTSALTAIMRHEPERDTFVRAIVSTSQRLISAVTALEAMLVIEGRYGTEAGGDLELLIHRAGIEIVPFDARQFTAAANAWRKYGKSNHPAALNLGDCCVYALAKVTGLPVLAKGADFPKTDIPLAPIE